MTFVCASCCQVKEQAEAAGVIMDGQICFGCSGAHADIVSDG